MIPSSQVFCKEDICNNLVVLEWALNKLSLSQERLSKGVVDYYCKGDFIIYDLLFFVLVLCFARRVLRQARL